MSISGRIGRSRIRRPVARWTAFAIAGATPRTRAAFDAENIDLVVEILN